MEVPIDVADALQEALNAAGHNASATPLPADFEDRLPFTRVSALGGTRTQRVLDSFNVHIDTWGATHAEAIREANAIVGLLADIAGEMLGDVQCYTVEFGGLPHEDEDPTHPDLPVASFMAQVTVRTRHLA